MILEKLHDFQRFKEGFQSKLRFFDIFIDVGFYLFVYLYTCVPFSIVGKDIALLCSFSNVSLCEVNIHKHHLTLIQFQAQWME